MGCEYYVLRREREGVAFSGVCVLMSCRYVWGDNVHKAKTQCESIDYILQLAVEMKKLGLPWTKS